MKFNYAVLAVPPDQAAKINEIDEVQILASTWYEDPPTSRDVEELYEEYRTDEELGMVGVDFTLVWRLDRWYNDNLFETIVGSENRERLEDESG